VREAPCVLWQVHCHLYCCVFIQQTAKATAQQMPCFLPCILNKHPYYIGPKESTTAAHCVWPCVGCACCSGACRQPAAAGGCGGAPGVAAQGARGVCC
jgi:hypothetical protein